MNLIKLGYQKISIAGYLTQHIFKLYCASDLYVYYSAFDDHFKIGDIEGHEIADGGDTQSEVAVALSEYLEKLEELEDADI